MGPLRIGQLLEQLFPLWHGVDGPRRGGSCLGQALVGGLGGRLALLHIIPEQSRGACVVIERTDLDRMNVTAARV
eukprot:3150073-Alexandrium_andersonii.AAC.1